MPTESSFQSKNEWLSAAAALPTEKPFCDGTHSKIGFKAAEKAVPESKE